MIKNTFLPNNFLNSCGGQQCTTQFNDMPFLYLKISSLGFSYLAFKMMPEEFGGSGVRRSKKKNSTCM